RSSHLQGRVVDTNQPPEIPVIIKNLLQPPAKTLLHFGDLPRIPPTHHDEVVSTGQRVAQVIHQGNDTCLLTELFPKFGKLHIGLPAQDPVIRPRSGRGVYSLYY